MSDAKPKKVLKSKDQEANQWAMFVHFSVLAVFAMPIAGFVLPIIIWQLKKDEFPIVDVHGKIVLNWLISALIYSVISAILLFFVVGALGLIAVVLCTLIFPVIGGIKANNGEVYQYPLSLTIVK
ncbi:MAG: DUF4870 domain-containing protein [Coxiellaceae bacterium]|nr:DUF4870 domain-containing protein [Coxiellaceae bacterium]